MVHRTLPMISPLGIWNRHQPGAGVPDAELLRRVADGRDESAFAALVERHGPRVWGVCLRIAGDSHLAEDVFQATFLLLIRKPQSVRNPAALAAWLHGAAYRLAVQARRQARRRSMVERQVARKPMSPPDDLSARELFAILDEELSRLPDTYRAPLILCFIDGLTQDEAARRLGVSAGSIKGRLERGRARLAARLRRRGFGPPTLLLASFMAVAIPASVSAKTLKLIRPGTVISAAVAALARKSTMALSLRIATACAMLLSAGVAGVSVALFGGERPADPPPAAKAEAPKESQSESLPLGAVARLGTTRLRPGGSIDYLAFSPDGKRLASFCEVHSGAFDSSIWDVATGRELKRIPLPGNLSRAVSWLSDGRGAAVMNLNWLNDGGFFLWDFATENAAQPPVGNAGVGVRMVLPNPPDNESDACFAVSPDGKFVAVGRRGNENRQRPIELREFTPGKRIEQLKLSRRLGLHPSNCDYLNFTPDGKTLLSINKIEKDGKAAKELAVIIWDVPNGKERRRLTVPAPTTQGFRPALAVSNHLLAIGLEDEAGTLRLYDIASGTERSLSTGHKSSHPGGGYGVSAVAFAPDGRTIVTGGRDNAIRVWDAASQKLRHTLTGHNSWVETLAISPDGKTLASGGQDNVIRLWNLATGVDACPQPGHTGGLSGISISADGRTAITAGRDGSLRIWDIARASELRAIRVNAAISRTELSPDRRMLVAGGYDQPVKAWDAATGKPARLPGKLAEAKATRAHFADSKTLLTFGDGTVTLWNWPAGTIRQSFELPPPEKKPGTPYCQDAALSPDGKLLVTVANRYWYREERGMRFGYAADGVIDLWDTATGKRLRRLLRSDGCPRAAIFTADGELVIQGGGQLLNADGAVEQNLTAELNLIDPLTSRPRRAFAPMPNKAGASFRYVMALALSPDGRSLYVADSSGIVAVYEVATGQIRRTIGGHRALLTDLAISRDGKQLLTASLDATALVWDLAPAAAFPRSANPPSAQELAKGWSDLLLADSAAAYQAMAVLDAAPGDAVALIAGKVSPARPGPDASALDRLVVQLGSEKFAVREKATAEIARLGEAVVPGLRDRLAKTESAEVRRRLIQLLGQLDPAETSPQRLQTQRALKLLEAIATPEAKALLAKLAAGDATARLTRDAKQSLARLEARK